MASLIDRINAIADGYAVFTGKSGSWKQQITISEYNDLRKQAVWEENNGIECASFKTDVQEKISREPPDYSSRESWKFGDEERNRQIGKTVEIQSENVSGFMEHTLSSMSPDDIDEETKILLSINEDM